MADEIVTRLMNWSDESTVLWEAVYELRDSKKEIERLRRMAMTLIDELRQNGGYEAYTPKMLFQEFYEEAHRG